MNISITNDIRKIKEHSKRDSINILFTGDFYSDRCVSDLVKSKEFDKLFNDFIPFSQDSDISVTNLECPLTNRENPIRKAGPTLKGPVETVNALKYAGFNVVCLANNHIMDYGETGLNDTIDVLDSKSIKHVGAGKLIGNAVIPLIIEGNGYKIAFLNIAEHEFSIASKNRGGAAPLDEVANYYQIKAAKECADFLVLIIHGGHEMYPLPSPRMTKIYRYFADLGVNAIIGHHAHVFTGYEIYKGVPIFYNLGNFIFNMKSPDMAWCKGFAVNLIINKNGISHIYLIPYTQFFRNNGVHVLQDAEISEFTEQISEYNDIISDEDRLIREFKSFTRKKRIYYLSTVLGLNKYEKKLMKMNIFPGFFINRKRLMNRLNQFRCQAHRDAVIEVLRNELKTN